MANFACCVVYDDDVQLRFLVQDSISFNDEGTWISEVQTKFPGGMQRPRSRESLVKTMQRELFEELGLKVRTRHKISKKVLNRSSAHAQHAFLARFQDCRGKLRTEPVIDGDTIIFAPYWASVQDLDEKLLVSHLRHLRAALRELGVFKRS